MIILFAKVTGKNRLPTSNLEVFFDNLYQFLHKHSTNTSKCLILADVNINNLNISDPSVTMVHHLAQFKIKALRLSTYPTPG